MSFMPGALGWALIDGAVGLAVSFVLVTILMPSLIRFFKRRGRVGNDVHKLGRPEVADLGGAGIILGILAGLGITALLIRFGPFVAIQTNFPLGTAGFLTIYRDSTFTRTVELGVVVLAAGALGLYDDLSPLKGRMKPALTLLLAGLAFAPFVASYYSLRSQFPNDPKKLSFFYAPYIAIPGHAPVSLTILFPLIAVFGITIGANAMNMMDIYNGVMPLTTTLIVAALSLSALVLQRYEAFYLLLPFLGAILAYYRFNKYPARIFSGDVGSLAVGAGLVAIAFLSRLEIVLLVAFIPFIINGLDTILSVGFRERRDMGARPTILRDDGKIALNPNPKAPVPLANLFLLDGPRTEKELIRDFVLTVAFSSFLSVLTAVVMYYFQ